LPRGGFRDVDAVIVEEGDHGGVVLEGLADRGRHVGAAALAGVDDLYFGIRRRLARTEFGVSTAETPHTEPVDGEGGLRAHPAVVDREQFLAVPAGERARREREVVKRDS